MAYAQWIQIHIWAENCSLIVHNASLEWGKFYRRGCKDDELGANDINRITIKSGSSAYVCSCGRENASSGTVGSFDIVEDSDEKTLITHVRWECPWSGNNSRSHEKDNQGYGITMIGGESKDHAIGDVDLVIFKQQ